MISEPNPYMMRNRNKRSVIDTFLLLDVCIAFEMDRLFYSRDDFFLLFFYIMFPESENCPSFGFKLLAIRWIPIDIGFNFWFPILNSRFWRLKAFRTSVPKASVEKNRNFFSDKCKIGSDSWYPSMKTISLDSLLEQSFSEDYFNSRIFSSDPWHDFASFLFRYFIHGKQANVKTWKYQSMNIFMCKKTGKVNIITNSNPSRNPAGCLCYSSIALHRIWPRCPVWFRSRRFRSGFFR